MIALPHWRGLAPGRFNKFLILLVGDLRKINEEWGDSYRVGRLFIRFAVIAPGAKLSPRHVSHSWRRFGRTRDLYRSRRRRDHLLLILFALRNEQPNNCDEDHRQSRSRAD